MAASVWGEEPGARAERLRRERAWTAEFERHAREAIEEQDRRSRASATASARAGAAAVPEPGLRSR
ncbi:hypothetical protein [Kitasatospora sp. NBC_00458]|uniref:hypothetical protein n=1 Tax=Kitasatospora sp. NBC_00458 TaxID=2903568 RepID=UPI002E178298